MFSQDKALKDSPNTDIHNGIAEASPFMDEVLLATSVPLSSGNGGSNPLRQKRANRGQATTKSQAKRRMEAMANSLDHKLAAAFSIILILYAVITFGTWMTLERQQLTSLPPVESAGRTTNGISLAGYLVKSASGKAEIGTERHFVRAEDIQDIETLQHTFPVHASNDMEVIDHPGILLANKESMKAILNEHKGSLPADGKMKVPKFWRPTCYGPKGVRYFLGNHGDELITPVQAAQIGSYNHEGLETIFISVASYRDPECQPTVSDIFERADHPERIRVAIIDQRVEGDDTVPPCGQAQIPCDQDPDQAMCTYGHLIDVYTVDAILSVGPGKTM